MSSATDELWEARKRVLAVASDIETLIEIIDPKGEERYADHDGDEFKALEYLMVWKGRLDAANRMLMDVSDTMKTGVYG